MNCDLVFEILTRGPFPSGEPTDASVELHLTRCHECRQLAEALRPAVALFHEVLSDGEDARSLPGYYGAAGAEEAATAILTASAATGRSVQNQRLPAPRLRQWKRVGPIGRMACGAGLGAVLCLLLAFLVTSATSPERGSPAVKERAHPASHASRGASADEMRIILASLQLPLACFGPGGENEAPSSTGAVQAKHAASRLLCCTHCHNSAVAHRPTVSAVALLQREACGVCHSWQ
jgi:hypothetical protein